MENTTKKTWLDFEHDYFNHIPKAIELNWKPKFDYKDEMYHRISPENPPMNGVSFSKDNKVAWFSINRTTGKRYWIVADFIDKTYCNHRNYDTLDDVFLSE